MVQIPSGPYPRKVEPGTQTEKASPSAVFWLHPVDMRGFRYLTISVALRLTLPIYSYKDDLVQAINVHQVLVIVGETSSGKTTQIP